MDALHFRLRLRLSIRVSRLPTWMRSTDTHQMGTDDKSCPEQLLKKTLDSVLAAVRLDNKGLELESREQQGSSTSLCRVFHRASCVWSYFPQSRSIHATFISYYIVHAETHVPQEIIMCQCSGNAPATLVEFVYFHLLP